jgi:hypothetical protein
MNEPTQEVIKFSELAKFFPKQMEALEASKRFKYVLFGGSVGSGKSYWIRWSVIYWLMKYYSKYNIKGIRAGVFCEDYPSLNDRHLTKIKFEFPEWLGRFNEAKHEFTLAPEYGSGIIAFRNLDDPSKYLSVEFAVIAIDEVNRNPKPTFDMLRTRHRWPGIKDVRFIAGCNPIGEAWVKNMWVKRMFPPDEKEQYEFVFVPALPTDNPHLPAEYYKALESQPENIRKAYLEGNWDSFDEGMDEKGYLRLMSDRELQASFVANGEHSGYKILGVDPAAGGDCSALVVKSGNVQEIVFNQKLRDTMDLVGVIMEKYREYKCDFIVIDKSGVGQGVFDRIKQLDYPVRGVSFGEKSEDTMFANLKAEWHWRERQWLLSGGRLIQNYGWNEFEYVKYKNKDGKLIIQPKEELFREGLMSPNCVDAAVLTQVINENTIKTSRMMKANGGRPFVDKMKDVWDSDIQTPEVEIYRG